PCNLIVRNTRRVPSRYSRRLQLPTTRSQAPEQRLFQSPRLGEISLSPHFAFLTFIFSLLGEKAWGRTHRAVGAVNRNIAGESNLTQALSSAGDEKWHSESEARQLVRALIAPERWADARVCGVERLNFPVLGPLF